jgi:hypothetical protein
LCVLTSHIRSLFLYEREVGVSVDDSWERQKDKL